MSDAFCSFCFSRVNVEHLWRCRTMKTLLYVYGRRLSVTVRQTGRQTCGQQSPRTDRCDTKALCWRHTERDPTRRRYTIAGPYTNDIIHVSTGWHLIQWSDPHLASAVNCWSPVPVKYCAITRLAIKSCGAHKLAKRKRYLDRAGGQGARSLRGLAIINHDDGSSDTTCNYQHSPSAVQTTCNKALLICGLFIWNKYTA